MTPLLNVRGVGFRYPGASSAGGEVVEQGPTGVLLDVPEHPYTRILVDSIPGREGAAEARSNELDNSAGCAFARMCPLVTDECLSIRPTLRSTGERMVACIRIASAPAARKAK
jgi:oligopeptide/dipeptide ABC transporter ATP-binding protein